MCQYIGHIEIVTYLKSCIGPKILRASREFLLVPVLCECVCVHFLIFFLSFFSFLKQERSSICLEEWRTQRKVPAQRDEVGSCFHYFKKIMDSHCGFLMSVTLVRSLRLLFLALPPRMACFFLHLEDKLSVAIKSILDHHEQNFLNDQAFCMPAVRKLEQGTGYCRNICKKKPHHNQLVLFSKRTESGWIGWKVGGMEGLETLTDVAVIVLIYNRCAKVT